MVALTVVATGTRWPGIRFRVAGKLTGAATSRPAAYPPDLSSTCWWDLSTRVRTVEVQTGTPPGPGNRLAPGGSWTVQLLNQDRLLDRLNSASSLYNKLPLGAPVWVALNYAGTSYDLIHGVIDEIIPRLDPGGASWVEMRGFDRLAAFVETAVKPTTSTGGEGDLDRTDTRFTRAFGQAGVTAVNNFSLRSGETYMSATTFGATIGDELEEVVRLEGGESRIFQKRNGKLAFYSANSFREVTASWVSQRTYSSGSIRYDDLSFSETRDRLRNSAVVGRAHSTLGYEYTSTSYVDLYGPHSTSQPDLRAAFDADARAVPDQTVWRRRQLVYGVDQITVRPGRNPATIWPSILAQEVFDRVTVKWRTAVNRAANVAGSTYTLDHFVCGWTARLDWADQDATYDVMLEAAPGMFSSTGANAWLQIGSSASTYRLGF